jgi:hypothetical protein
MPLLVGSSMRLEWKWVRNTLLLYVLFYLVPLLMVDEIPVSNGSVIFAGIWLFAGIVVVAAVAGYLSEGVTIWEPAIAGVVLFVLCFIANATLPIRIALLQNLAPPGVTLAVVFILSLYGAKWGEFAQELWRKKSQE